MVQQQIIHYILTHLKQGYDVKTIRDTLIKNGWPAQPIDEAITYIYQNNLYTTKPEAAKHTFDITPKSLAAFVGIAAIILISVFAMVFVFGGNEDGKATPGPKTPSQLLDFKITVTTKEVTLGGQLQFTNSLVNMGTDMRYDIELEYDIVDLKDNKIIDSWKESRAISTTIDKSVTRQISSNYQPGTYRVNAKVIYDEGQRVASAAETFIVTRQEDPTDKDKDKDPGDTKDDCNGSCPPQEDDCDIDCEDGNPCTEDFCVQGVCYHRDITPCCGNGRCEEGEDEYTCPSDCPEKRKDPTLTEIKDQAEQLVRSDISSAGEYCLEISIPNDRDYCFRLVAHASGNMNFCDYIETESIADFCYLRFGTAGDMSACSKIKHLYTRQACETYGGR